MQRLSITEARRQLMNLADRLDPGESVEVMKRRHAILRISRPADSPALSPLQALDFALDMVSPARPRDKKPAVASRYKKLLYGRKKNT